MYCYLQIIPRLLDTITFEAMLYSVPFDHDSSSGIAVDSHNKPHRYALQSHAITFQSLRRGYQAYHHNPQHLPLGQTRYSF